MQELQDPWVQSLSREDPLEKAISTPVFLPGKSHVHRGLMGYSPLGGKKSDMTEQLSTHARIRDQIIIKTMS